MFQTRYDKNSKLWFGNQLSPLYNPNLSLGEFFWRALTTNGPKIAQVCDDSGDEMTFNEIRTSAVRAALSLQTMGYEPGTVFGFMARNTKNVAPIVFASLFIGCPLSTLDPSFGNVELVHMLKTTKPSLMFCDTEVYDLVEHCLHELGLNAKIFTFGGQKGNSQKVESLFVEHQDEDAFSPLKVDAENHIAIIICSSGTTGLSKGVSLTHAVLTNAAYEFNITNSDDIMLCFSPLYWITGILTLVMGTFCGAKRIITKALFAPDQQLRIIDEHKVTYILGPPYHISLLLSCELLPKANLTSLKYHVIGGSKVPVGITAAWNEYLGNGKKVHNLYGLSEAGGVISIDYPECGKIGCAGRLVNGCSVKIIDDDGNRCGPNVKGEICTKLSYKFIGYYGNEEATLEMFDDEDFMRTGDIGYFDSDGDLFIVDRKKNQLKYRNFQITPSEIEDLVIKHPDVKSVCVVGIPDNMSSDLPTAVIIREEKSTITEQEVHDIVASHFADYFKLRGGVYFVKSLPISSSGKVLKRVVRDHAIELYNEKNR